MNKSVDTLWSFYVFNELITNDTRIFNDKYENTRDFLWDQVKIYYRTFVEWYNDNTYYHIIGFLLQVDKNIESIKKLTENHPKNILERELQILIQNHFGEIDLEQIGYDFDYKKAKELLLLFNIVTTMNSRYNRFAFDVFANQNWSLEHIHAQQSEELKTDKQKRHLLNEQKKYFSYHNKSELLDEIEQLLAMSKIEQDRFDIVQNKVFNEYSDSATTHSIKNLALLAVPDNSCLNNNIFPIKRDLIKSLDEKGSFIPICTKNVFLKYYSKDVEQNVKWDKDDMKSYLEEIKIVLKKYIKIKENEYEAI
ncbi:hypothetical protein LRS05_09210 [Flavobacterium sp. J372]|uniref:hypothetical protein n=1 Tax=Flavobacterium sp. J372 TaxID=2898436 RepID=UPI0021509ACF|nr:hypothetical protein [Flavobacterium sp. J372]MCR5862311.1 hypothetical protein [Flavobacterium sp. J372]